MSAHEPSHAAAGIPLKAPVEELGSRCEAVARFQGGSTYFHEELGIFRQYAEESGLFLHASPVELIRTPDEHRLLHPWRGHSEVKIHPPRPFATFAPPR